MISEQELGRTPLPSPSSGRARRVGLFGHRRWSGFRRNSAAELVLRLEGELPGVLSRAVPRRLFVVEGLSGLAACEPPVDGRSLPIGFAVPGSGLPLQ